MATTKTDPPTRDGPAADDPTFADECEDAGLGTLRWVCAVWLDAMADMNTEVVNFVAKRIKEDVKTQRELLHCTSLEDVQHAQLTYLNTAYHHYTDETGKLVKMGLDLLPPSAKSTPL